jgi:methyltransferase (TIGR00027 family)
MADELLQPENTAVRVALWRANHVLADAPPHVIEDLVGLQLADPPAGWQRRPDLNPEYTKIFRASIVARARFIEDLVVDASARGVDQYVLLGAGLDTFAQRRPEIASRMHIFEIDQPGPQAWKRQRLTQLGYDISERLHFVPVNFETELSWLELLTSGGFDEGRPAIVASAGVSMYLTKEAVAATLQSIASFAHGSALVMSFMLPFEYASLEIRPGLEMAERGARQSGTPFVSYFTPSEIVALARASGFSNTLHVSAAELGQRYFAGRADGLRPPENTEELLVATT